MGDHQYTIDDLEEMENLPSNSDYLASKTPVTFTDDDLQFQMGEFPSINLSSSIQIPSSRGLLTSSGSVRQPSFQDIVDEDLTEHDDVLNAMFIQCKSAARQHLTQIKQRISSESETSSQNDQRRYLDLIQSKNDEIETLREQLKAAEGTRDSLSAKLEVFKENFSNKLARSRLHIATEFSVFKVFNYWKQLVVDRKNECLHEKFAVIMRRRSLLSQSFARINRENNLQKLTKLKRDHQVAIDQVTKQVVEAYEGDLNRLRHEASEAHTASRHEQLRRRQLEEDLRRMLLKNMTAMNFEALSLFQHTTVSSPPEQQQTIGELKDIITSTADISCIETENRGDAPRSDQFTSNTHTFSSSLGSSNRCGYEGSLGDSFGEEGPRRSQPTPIPTSSTTEHSFRHPPHRDLSLAGSQRQGPEPVVIGRRSRTGSGLRLRPPVLPQKDRAKEISTMRSGALRSARVP